MFWQPQHANGQKSFERDMALRAGAGVYVVVALVMLMPAGGLALFLWPNRNDIAQTVPWLTVFFLAEILAGLLLVARWFQRLTTSSDIEELKKVAFSYRLGGTLALRPFLNPGGETLDADSSLGDYRNGITEPNFYKTATNPPFFLALILVVSLGLFAFYGPRLGLLGVPMIPLLGPELANWSWQDTVTPDPTKLAGLSRYGAGALVAVAFAFAGSLVWAVIYMTRRMALRDVTAHTYQEVTMRLVASAVLALVIYHVFASTEPAAGMPWGELLMVIAFGVGVMPETVLRWIANKAARLFDGRKETDAIDLENIQGISPFTRSRLVEVGVYDVQGLVSANPLRLSLHTPYSLPQVMDWIGQSFLLLHFGPEGFAAWRQRGVRTVWELEGVAPTLAAEPAAEPVPRVLAALDTDPNYVRATQIQMRMRDSGRPRRLPAKPGDGKA